jgi:ribosome-associated protein
LDLIRRAAHPPLKRRATKPPAAARERRIESKKRRAGIKRLRQAKSSFD